MITLRRKYTAKCSLKESHDYCTFCGVIILTLFPAPLRLRWNIVSSSTGTLQARDYEGATAVLRIISLLES